MKSETIKKGQTLAYTLAFSDDEPADYTGYALTAAAQSETDDSLHNFNCSWTDAPNGLAKIAADTASWPLGAMKFDLKLESPDGDVMYSETIMFFVKEAITP